MIVHLIALAKLGDESFAYHFSSDQYSEIVSKRLTLVEKTADIAASFSLHLLKTNNLSFNSVQEMDPYFDGVKPISDLNVFIKKVHQYSKLTSLDLASYLIRTYNLKPFSLQKTLYYMYADYLVSHQEAPFKANFVAFDKGPVDKDVYRIDKHASEALQEGVSFETKAEASGKFNRLVRIIDESVKKYSAYFDTAWGNDNKENPTHRKNTPWWIAYHKHGQNAPINDTIILKFHYVEKLC